MKWVKSHCLNPSDTVCSLAYGPSRLLAYAAWDGTVAVASPLETLAQVQFSRPMFSVAWEPFSGRLLTCGAERRVSAIDVEHHLCADTFQHGESPFLEVSSVEPHVFAVATRSGLLLGDLRAGNSGGSRGGSSGGGGGGSTVAAPSAGSGGSSVDVLNGSIVVAGSEGTRVFDWRNLTNWVSQYPIKQLGHGDHMHHSNPVPLRAVWLRAGLYAVADSVSRIAVVNVADTADTYVFKTNRSGQTAEPIYSLARGIGEQTLVSGGADKNVSVWDFEQRRLVSQAAFPLSCTALACSRSGGFAVGLSTDQWRHTNASFDAPSRSRVMVAVA